MGRKGRPRPEITEEGLRNTLGALLKAQGRYSGYITGRYFTDSCVYLFVPKEIKDPEDKEHIRSYLSEADKRGYLERGALHIKLGRGESMRVGFKIKKDKLAEIEKLLQ